MVDPRERERIARLWHEPAALYAHGYPASLTSALRVFEPVRAGIEDMVRAAAPERALEVGPGDRPVIAGTAHPVYLDVSAAFLRPLAGERVQGDLRRPPFRAGAFDLAVANDVLTHVPPADRLQAVAALADLAPRLVIFTPGRDSEESPFEPPDSDAFAALLGARGFEVEERTIVAVAQARRYEMWLLLAWRAAPPGGRP
jgi:hypothetical protein